MEDFGLCCLKDGRIVTFLDEQEYLVDILNNALGKYELAIGKLYRFDYRHEI